MTTKSSKLNILFSIFIAVGFFAGCHKKIAATPPAASAPVPPPPAVPTVTLQVSPANIVKGGDATLSWSSTNATQVILSPGLGSVNVRGSQQVYPSESTTYTITAAGAGGRADASARVTVSIPPIAEKPSPTLEQLFQEIVKDAFFDYNTADIRSDARDSLLKDSEFLSSHPEVRVAIEGHCDERGSEEYNLGLGDRRATSAKKYMVSLGIAESRIQTTSYGKERPFCTEHNEACWQQNRRAHFVMLH